MIRLLFFFIPFLVFSAQYKLVVTSMFKNEAPWLKEWIEYHRIIGVEHFYLYNNDSTDSFMEVLEPYVKEGIVDVIPWESNPSHWHPHPTNAPLDNYWAGYQYGAFDDSISKLAGVSKWVAIIDIDEFLFPLGGPVQGVAFLHQLLDNAPDDIGSYCFLMTNFGTSFVEKIPKGTLMTERLILRGNEYKLANHCGVTKCIHNPLAVDRCEAHEAVLKKGYRMQNIPENQIRINHYYTRDRSFCRSRRGDPRLWEARYTLFDDSMLQFSPLLKEALNR